METDVATAETEEGQEESTINFVEAGTGYEDENGEEQTLTVRIPFNPGANLDTACELYGEEAVFQRYVRGVTKDCGNAIRARERYYLGLEGENAVPVDEIPGRVQADLADWRPDVTRRAAPKDPTQTILANFSNLTSEKQAELIQQLMATAEAS